MAAAERLSYDKVKLIWELLQSGVDTKLVMEATGVSVASVRRVNGIFSLAAKGDIEAMMDYENGNYREQKRYALQYFKLTPPVKSDEAPAPNNDLAEVCARLSAISYGITQMIEKLDKLCEAWEVNK